MLTPNGEKQLRQFSERAYPKKMHRINERIYCFVGYGTSNCIVIEAQNSLILIDALDSDLRAAQVRQEMEHLTGKRVKTLIYTHGHPDHSGGAGAFRDSLEEIIAFSPSKPALKHTERIMNILSQRGARQFGYQLQSEDVFTQGIGIREGRLIGEGKADPLPAMTIYSGTGIERDIDGVRLRLVPAVGETEDQIFVWLPEDKVLCCGDNYYGCWPNLYAIRGGPYRDIAAWLDSLGQILRYPAKALLPGHTEPLLGYDHIQDVLGTYKDAIESILLQTLDCMNRGLSIEATVEQVALPAKYRDKPYLQEHYGSVAWSVRAIYTGYMGWFDGNPSHLHPLPEKEYANRLLQLIGDSGKVRLAIDEALQAQEYQLAVQLCDLLLASRDDRAIRHRKAQGLLALAKLETSSNGRHYYLTCAQELLT